MIPVQECAGCYWQSGDRADIWLIEAGPEAPRVITCQTPQGCTAIVRVVDLNFIGAGLLVNRAPVWEIRPNGQVTRTAMEST
jgi:hypothetical protein